MTQPYDVVIIGAGAVAENVADPLLPDIPGLGRERGLAAPPRGVRTTRV